MAHVYILTKVDYIHVSLWCVILSIYVHMTNLMPKALRWSIADPLLMLSPTLFLPKGDAK